MKHLDRITTEYIAAEDRIRLTATIREGETVVAWFTQRLLQRLVPTLVQWLHTQGADPQGAGTLRADTLRADVMHGFAQQAARARMKPQAPVRAEPGGSVWLVQSIDVAQHSQVLRLTFKGSHGTDSASTVLGTLTLAPQPLRQWLNILFDNYRKAGWPLQAWPNWVAESGPQETPQPVVMH